ncbi:MAG TPA: outer membrane protein assembly factor BamB [Steroidobacteraceae bacterium]|nr:outer membrane protein assembly factor BamB [Steroidobacteraceae bacterium]
MLLRNRLLLLLIITVFVSACDNSKDIDPPATLVDIKPTLKVEKLWSEGLTSRKAKKLLLALQPSVDSGVVYAASHDGKVEALTADKGAVIWKTKTKLSLSAGPSIGENIVVVGSSNGILVVLDAKTGTEKWRLQMSGEVLAKPLIAQGLIVVRTVNNRLQALNISDSKTRWTVEETVPKLTLRGTGKPILADNAVITGFDDGKVVAVDLQTGDMLWSVVVDTPVGRTELEKLADVDAAAVASGRDVYVVGYHGRIAMLDQTNGQIWWAQEASSYRGLDMDSTALYVSGADGTVSAIKRTNGAQLWEQKALHQRGLTAPGVNGDTLVVGDYQGYVHWLSISDGSLLARASAGDRISNTPVVADGKVFVQTDKGKLVAYETRPKN